jgi:hypothetical protein
MKVGTLRRRDEVDAGRRGYNAAKIQSFFIVKSWNRLWEVNLIEENYDAYNHVNWRDCHGRVAFL